MRIPWSGRRSSTRSGRGSPPGGRRKWRLLIVPAMVIAVVCQLSVAGAAGAATAAATAKTGASGGVAPNAVNELDCNGWSKAYGTVRKLAGSTCVDPVTIENGKRFRFEDNGHYIGHDEPSVKFISSTPGSGNTMTYLTKIPVDPRQSPNPVRQRHELRPALRRALVRASHVRPEFLSAERVHPGQRHQHRSGERRPTPALAFMELQLYPPGYTPFIDCRELQRDQVVRGAQHRQPRVHVRLRHLQQRLHRAGQLRLPADQRRPGRTAEPAADERAARSCPTRTR